MARGRGGRGGLRARRALAAREARHHRALLRARRLLHGARRGRAAGRPRALPHPRRHPPAGGGTGCVRAGGRAGGAAPAAALRDGGLGRRGGLQCFGPGCGGSRVAGGGGGGSGRWWQLPLGAPGSPWMAQVAPGSPGSRCSAAPVPRPRPAGAGRIGLRAASPGCLGQMRAEGSCWEVFQCPLWFIGAGNR